MAQRADTIIVGGGLAGGLAALALSEEGLEVVLVDAEDPARFREESFDARTTALAYASARVFRRLHLWPAIERHAEPIRDILVTDGRAPSAVKRGASSAFHIHLMEVKGGQRGARQRRAAGVHHRESRLARSDL